MDDEKLDTFVLLKERHPNVQSQILLLIFAIIAVSAQIVITKIFQNVSIFSMFVLYLCVYLLVKLVVECSIKVKKIINFSEVNNILSATHVLIMAPDTESTIVKLESNDSDSVWVNFNHTKYIYNTNLNSFHMPCMYRACTFESFQKYKSLTDAQVSENLQTYGKNVIEMVCPSFAHVFSQKILSPSTIFNGFFMLLCIAEGYRLSIMISVVITVFDILVATFNEIHYNRTFKSYEIKPTPVKVLRNNSWTTIQSCDLVPGDILLIERSSINQLISCDLLLLKGSCLVDEAILTGESVPQIKESIETQNPAKNFNIDVHGKSHVLYNGTTLLNFTVNEKNSCKKSLNNSCSAIVIRTGFYTDKGKLFRSLLSSIHNENLNDKETYAYIFILFVFGVLIAAHTWFKRIYTPDVNKLLLLVHCVKLIVAVIPIDLSTKLLLFLQRLNTLLRTNNIFTMRMSKMPMGGKVDVCFFDKTGTLTEDRVTVHGVGALKDDQITPLKDLPLNNVINLIGCTSVFTYSDKIVGDPIDTAIVEAFSCNVTEDQISTSSPFSLSFSTQVKFPFESSLRRMSSLVVVQNNTFSRGYEYFGLVKGAPESLKNMFSIVPAKYDELNAAYSADGYRVIALGYKVMANVDSCKVTREFIEQDLQFGGFLLSNTKIKSDALETITSLKKMTLKVVMITGDNPFTACFVSRTSGISSKPLLILTVTPDDCLTWITDANVPFYPFAHDTTVFLWETHEFCLTGSSINKLRKLPNYDDLMFNLIPNTKVYARVDPHQKEYIIKYYKLCKQSVFMCGDGANDIGALRSSDVGVAMLNIIPKTEKSEVTPVKANPVTRLRKNIKAAPPPRDPYASPNSLFSQANEETLQPGDASIAAPFTLKGPETSRCLLFIKYCMCSLSYYQHVLILSTIYSLTYVYMQATHYAEGLVFSDRQQSFYGIVSMLIYYATFNIQPTPFLPRRKPINSLFHPYIVLTIIIQSIAHVYTIYYIAHYLDIEFPATNPLQVATDTAFAASQYNTALYYYEFFIMLAVYLVNYNGAPFSTPMIENRLFLLTLASLYIIFFSLVTNLLPFVAQYLQLVILPANVVYPLLLTIISNFVIVFGSDRLLYYIFV